MKSLLTKLVLCLLVLGQVACQMRRITIEDYSGFATEETSSAAAKKPAPTKASTKSAKGSKAAGAKVEKSKTPAEKPKTSAEVKVDKTKEKDTSSRVISFKNNYRSPVGLYWVNTDVNKLDMKLTDIPPLQEVNTTSFTDHQFYGVVNDGSDDARRATPYKLSIISKIGRYEFGPMYKPREGRHPAITVIDEVVENVRIKVKSLVRTGVSAWVDFQGQRALIYEKLEYEEEEYFNTRVGVHFYFTHLGQADKVLWDTVITRNHSYMVIEDKVNPPPREVLRATAKQLRHHSDYLAAKGFPWNAYYDLDTTQPRPPVHLFMWPAERIGDVHSVYSSNGYWNCEGKARFCQSAAPLKLDLEVVSVTPKVFIVPNLLSPFEVETIKQKAAPLLEESFIGSGKKEQRRVNSSRTSRNAWLHRMGNAVMETLFLRAADVLQIPESYLHRHVFAEDLQVVHYNEGEKYDSHYDWSNNGYPETRFITLLIYLSDMQDEEAGGETAFPKAPLNHSDPSQEGTGFKVQAGKGNAILFYNMLPDGNGDDLAYHAALPVIKGEKWVANFWVWDPKFH